MFTAAKVRSSHLLGKDRFLLNYPKYVGILINISLKIATFALIKRFRDDGFLTQRPCHIGFEREYAPS